MELKIPFLQLRASRLYLLIVAFLQVWRGCTREYTISAVCVEPYTMVNPSKNSIDTNADYIGFIPDLMLRLSRMVGFSYHFKPLAANEFGTRLPNGSWDGMIGEVMNGRADIAAGPLFSTKPRQRAVLFTRPFLSTEATVLLRRPPRGQPPGIQSVRDLLFQKELKYGTLDVGMIRKAFESTNNSVYRRLWRRMADADPPVLTSTNAEGIERVRKEKYVFILPSTIADYIIRQKPCDLITVTRFLIKKGYSLAIRKGHYRFKKELDKAIYSLQQDGYIDKLYREWWIHQDKCDSKPQRRRDGRKNAGCVLTDHQVYHAGLFILISLLTTLQNV